MGNLDGSLDNFTDEELARLHPDREDEESLTRPCFRCGGDFLLYWHGPLGTRVWMELCPACDAGRPAVRAFVRWYRDTDRYPQALPRLFEDWETMHSHGWARVERPAAPASPTRPDTSRSRVNTAQHAYHAVSPDRAHSPVLSTT